MTPEQADDTVRALVLSQLTVVIHHSFDPELVAAAKRLALCLTPKEVQL